MFAVASSCLLNRFHSDYLILFTHYFLLYLHVRLKIFVWNLLLDDIIKLNTNANKLL